MTQHETAASELKETSESGHAILSRGALVLRSVNRLRKHPAYAELNLAVSPAQLAALKIAGKLALKDPLLVTQAGLIIDGYARREYAISVGISSLPCVEFDVGEEEALQMILNKHRRSPGWNDYNRLRMASRLKDSFRSLARSNQQAGGRFKGSSKLTEASVRKRLADTAGVCEGNVTKYDQLSDSDPEVLNALANGEVRIHRAWLWRRLNPQQQREELRLYRLKRGLKQPAKIRALRHQANGSPPVARTTISMGSLEQLLGELSSTPCGDCESSDLISIGLINAPSKAALLTTALYEDLLARRSVNHQCDAQLD